MSIAPEAEMTLKKTPAIAGVKSIDMVQLRCSSQISRTATSAGLTPEIRLA